MASTACTLMSLPNDVLRLIGNKYLTPEERLPVRFVNRRLRYLCAAKDNDLSKAAVWRLAGKTSAAYAGWLLMLNPLGSAPLWQQGLLGKFDHFYHMAAKHGNLEVLQWASKRNLYLDSRPSKKYSEQSIAAGLAAYSGNLKVLQWLLQNGSKLHQNVFALAAAGGHDHVLEWLHSQGCPCDENVTASAAAAGRVSVLKQLVKEGCPLSIKAASATVEANGELFQKIKKIAIQNCPNEWDPEKCQKAAERSDKAFIAWLQSINYPIRKQMKTCRTYRGHLKVLAWLQNGAFPTYYYTSIPAIKAGHLELLKFLHRHKYPLEGMYTAAKCGQLQIVSYLHQKGCAWDREAPIQAAKCGYLDVLEYFAINECPINVTDCIRVANPNAISWIVHNLVNRGRTA